MAEPFLGEIRMMSFAFAPGGWAHCNGQQLPVNQNQALFSLLGTRFGGNGTTTFGLPDMRGRVPLHFGDAAPVGTAGGSETVTLSVAQLPEHSHVVQATTAAAAAPVPNGALLATGPELYSGGSGTVQLAGDMLGMTGGGQAHQNMQPYLTINFCIALQGIFPSRT